MNHESQEVDGVCYEAMNHESQEVAKLIATAQLKIGRCLYSLQCNWFHPFWALNFLTSRLQSILHENNSNFIIT